MKPTKLGRNGPDVFPIGLGCMGMSGIYGQTTDAEGIATIHAAIARAELGASATLYGVFSRGLLGGKKPTGPRDVRNHFPRSAASNSGTNDAIVGWVLAKQPSFVPIVGARTALQLEDILGTLEKPLSKAEVAQIESLVPKDSVAGNRYADVQMKQLDSERAP